jgi:ribonuclease HI
MEIKIYTDGGSRGNPGKSACAFLVVKNNKIILHSSKYLGKATNNEAEYNAVIEALSQIKAKSAHVYSDSEVIINQINGKYKVNLPHLQKLREKVIRLCENRKVTFSNVSRENKYITKADFLVNQKLDEG